MSEGSAETLFGQPFYKNILNVMVVTQSKGKFKITVSFFLADETMLLWHHFPEVFAKHVCEWRGPILTNVWMPSNGFIHSVAHGGLFSKNLLDDLSCTTLRGMTFSYPPFVYQHTNEDGEITYSGTEVFVTFQKVANHAVNETCFR
jgi:hypothetical protein